jgi:hypothetical protein
MKIQANIAKVAAVSVFAQQSFPVLKNELDLRLIYILAKITVQNHLL